MSELSNYKCPNCGGNVKFNIETQQLTCESCGGTFKEDTFSEGQKYTYNETKYEDSNLGIYVCDNCGGEIIADEVTAAKACPYCGNPVVMKSNVSGENRPTRIIPFKFDKKQAIANFKKHLENKVLLPNEFKTAAVFEEIKGIYVPYWTFSGTANARMWFDATKVRSWSDGNYDYTETSYYKLFRAGNVSFDDVPVDASSKIDDSLTQSIEPFDTNGYKEFSEDYLAGFYADKYDVSAENSSIIANNRISNSTREIISSTTSGYTTCTPTSSSVSVNQGIQEYVMLPLWILNVKYKGKKYQFAMNGQTGKFVGNLPKDKNKEKTLGIIAFILVSAIAALIQFLMIKGA